MRVIHMFQYPLNVIRENLNLIKSQGFDTIMISPITPTKEHGNEFWLLYQPLDFTIGNTQIGTKEELINLCESAHKIGLKIIQDVVLRHIATDPRDKTKPHKDVNRELLKYLNGMPNATNYNDRNQVISYATGMPMFDYNNSELHQIYIKFLDELIECGVDGFRLDQAKHYALPRETRHYLKDEQNFFNNVWCRYKNKMLMGECIQCTRELLDEYSEYMLILSDCDTTIKNNLVSWILSHDDFLSFGKNMSDEMLVNEYRILVNNYPNTLFYTRPFNDTWKTKAIREINNR